MTTLLPKYYQGSAGAVNRPFNLKLQEFVSVKDFGAKGDATTDDLAAINAAIAAVGNAGGGVVYFPPGQYLVSGVVTFNYNGVTLNGYNEVSSVITTNNATADIVCVGNGSANPNDVYIQNIGFSSTVAKTAGAAMRFRNGHSCGARNIRTNTNMYTCVQFDGGTQQFLYYLNNFEFNAGNRGIIVGDDGTLVQDLWVNNGVISSMTDSGILLTNVSGYYFDAIDVLTCTKGLSTFPNTGKQVVAGISNRIICDSSLQNGFNILTNGGTVADCSFVNCWASSNGSANVSSITNNGVYLDQGSGTINGVNFSSLRSTFNKGAGFYLNNAVNINLSSFQVFCNSTVGSAARSGIEVGVTKYNFNISNGFSGIGGIFGTNFQAYGISILSGCTSYSVSGVNLGGNVTGPMYNASAAASQTITGNVGYTNSYRGQTVVSAGQSTVTVAHGLNVTPNPYDFLLTPLTNISLGGVSNYWISATTSTTFTVSLNTATSTNLFFTWDVKSAGA